MPPIASRTIGRHSRQRDEALMRARVFRDQRRGRVFPIFAGIENEAPSLGDAFFREPYAKFSGVAGTEVAEQYREAAMIAC